MTQPLHADAPAPAEDDDDDPIRKLHDEVATEKAAFKARIAKRELSSAEIASFVDGTVMEFQKETLVVLGTLRDFVVDYVDGRIAEMTEESQILGEDAEKIVNLADGTLLLIASVRDGAGSSLPPETKKTLDLLEALAKEVRELTEAATVEGDEDEEGEDEEDDDSDDDGEA